MRRGERRPLLVGTVLLLLSGAFVVARLEVTTDITHFLPAAARDPDLVLARELATGDLSRTMVLLLRAGAAGTALTAGREFEAALRAEPRVAAELEYLDTGPPAGLEEALWRLYQPHRLALLARDAEAATRKLEDDHLRAAVRRLKQGLAQPISGLLSQVAPADPLLILPGLVERLAAGRAEGLQVVDGRFVADGGRSAVLFLCSRGPASDSRVQRPLLTGVRAAFAGVDARHGGGLELLQSGVNRFAVRAETMIRADIRRVTLGSIAALVLLFLSLFRSLRLVLLVLPVLAAGLVTGTSACLLLSGQVHGLTLAFGAGLIGVSIDYAVHFHCHESLAPAPEGPRQTLKNLWPGLALSAATTVLGFVALLASTFPGLREMAVFAAGGIGGALCATWLFLPGLVRSTPPTALGRSLVAAMARVTAPRGAARLVLLLPAALVLAVAGPGLSRLQWNDDITDLNRLDAALLREDEEVRDHVVRYEQRRLVVARGAGEEAALQVNDRVAEVLARAQARGILAGSRNVADLLPSAAAQRAVAAAVRGDATLWPRLRRVLAEEDFVAERFAPFAAALAAEAPPPLTWADLAASPLAPLVRPFLVRIHEDGGAGVAVLSFLHGIRDEAALRAELESVGARLLDVRGVLTGAYTAYREKMTALLPFGLVAICLLVFLRHRRVRPALAACLPPLLAAAGTMAILSLAGIPLNLLSLVALLMVVSMGVDYGVFLAEAGRDPRVLDATHLAVLVAGLSTILGFGLLAMSEQPALLSIGLTAGIGILLCLVLAPTMRSWLLGMGLLVLIPACATPRPAPAFTDADYPGMLQPPARLSADVMWQQRVTARWPDGERGFAAAVQKQADTLTVMGLAPLGPGFAFILRGDRIETMNPGGQDLPFPPRFILLDVQRVFYPWLPPAGPGATVPDGRREGIVGGERVVELWAAGRLAERTFTRVDRRPEGAITVRYAWDRADWLAPTRAVLANGWFGYELTVETAEETRLRP
jgi:predicted exporter